MSFTVLR